MKKIFAWLSVCALAVASEPTQSQVNKLNNWLESQNGASTYTCAEKGTIPFESLGSCFAFTKESLSEIRPNAVTIDIAKAKAAEQEISILLRDFSVDGKFYSDPLASNIKSTSKYFNDGERKLLAVEAYTRYIKRHYKNGSVRAIYIGPSVKGEKYIPAKIVFGKTYNFRFQGENR